MAHELSKYAAQPSTLSTELQPAVGGEGPVGLSLGATLRRRWRMIVTIWALVVILGLPYIWLRMHPTFTATAQVEVAPMLPAILYNDAESRAMPFYGEFLNTQALKIASPDVVSAALKQNSVQDLLFVKEGGGVTSLLRSIEVTNPFRTHLLLIEVTQPDPESAVVLCRAIAKAYMDTVVSGEDSQKHAELEVLGRRLEDLEASRREKQAEIDELGKDYETSSGSMLNTLREALVESLAESRRALELVDLRIIELELKLEQLEAGNATVLQEQETDPAEIEDFIEDAPTVRALHDQLQSVSARLLKLTRVLTEEHKEVIATRREKAQLEAELEAERQRIAGTFGQTRHGSASQVLKDAISATQSELEVTRKHRERLLERINERDAEGMAMGRLERQLQGLQEEKRLIDEDYERVSTAIKQRIIEGQRPTRIKLVSDAQILPDGKRDKRKKFTLAAVFGGLFLGVFVVLIRDRLDSMLYGPQQIEAEMGLRLLGAVPCLSELKAGRVTHEDFVESYRVVRTTLSSLGPDGMPPQCMLVTSAQAGEGKTSLAISLSASLAETGARVLLIDADMQAPSIRRFFKLHDRPGLESVLNGDTPLHEAVIPVRIQGVDVLACGMNGEPTRGMLDWSSARRVIQAAAGHYQYVVVDSPPSLGAADALVWSRVVDGVVIASLAQRSDRTAMRLACERLRSVGATLLGAVVGNVSINETYYSHSVNASIPAGGWTQDARNQLPVVGNAAGEEETPSGTES